MLLSLVLAVVASVLAVFFANYNPSIVVVNVFGTAIKGTLGIIIVVAAGVGALVGVALMVPSLVSRSWAVIRYRRQLQDLKDTMLSTSGKGMPPRE
jgi:uncharacterized integral membrane protein